ncbi:hypothetical protein BaRGS_00018806 [Batillaria attramentaria]|uniref:Uncharacterized protein n=1 Tax=Batillaria attramentaria TaxID=370345 RepID=A0ABD0KRL4_9CAEN
MTSSSGGKRLLNSQTKPMKRGISSSPSPITACFLSADLFPSARKMGGSGPPLVITTPFHNGRLLPATLTMSFLPLGKWRLWSWSGQNRPSRFTCSRASSVNNR